MNLRPLQRRRLRRSHVAWSIIVVYEILHGTKGEMLSEAFDSWTVRHPWLSRAAIFYTAAHCANLLPPCADVYWMASVQLARLLKF